MSTLPPSSSSLDGGRRQMTLDDLLGPPRPAAEFLLRTVLAPESSGRIGTLLEASAEVRRRRTTSNDDDDEAEEDANSLVYQFEYGIDVVRRGDGAVEKGGADVASSSFSACHSSGRIMHQWSVSKIFTTSNSNYQSQRIVSASSRPAAVL